MELPGIGAGIGKKIDEILTTVSGHRHACRNRFLSCSPLFCCVCVGQVEEAGGLENGRSVRLRVCVMNLPVGIDGWGCLQHLRAA